MPTIQTITNASGSFPYVPSSRTLTINGVSYDLTADRSWTISTSGTGTVTSVGLSATMPTGLVATISGSPITSNGTLGLTVTMQSGYAIPTTAKQTQWDSAYTFTSTFPSGTANQLLRINAAGTALEFFTAPFLSSTGTTNYIPKFTSSSSIGNSTLTINTFSSTNEVLKLTSSNASSFELYNGTSTFTLQNFSNDVSLLYQRSTINNSILYYNGSSTLDRYLSLQTEGLDRLIVKQSGNILIGSNTDLNDKLQITGSVRISDALAIGTTPNTNLPFQILKNINSTVGIRFENTSTLSNAFSAIQFGTDVNGGTAFANLVYASSGITENGVYKPSGTALVNTGSGGLNLLSVSQPIRFFTSTGTGTERFRIKNDGQVRYIPLASAPANAEAGDMYYNSTDNKHYGYNGTSWNALY
jgi:hypothetical protein